MTATVQHHTQALVDLETKGWDAKNPDLFLSMIHPDMAWLWPPTPEAHDPVDWVFVMDRFDRERWRHKETKEDSHWQGRVCKIYTKMPGGEWKIIF